MTARKSLGDAFKPSGTERGSGLSGILAQRAAADAAAPKIQSPPEVAPRGSETKRVAAPASTSGDRVRSVPAYLDTDVRSELRQRTRREDVQNADLLLDAFDAVSEEAIRAALEPPALQTSGGRAPRRPRPEREQPKVQTNFRLNGAQEQWLDDLGAAVGAPSRTSLVNTALRLWFEM